MRLPKRGFSRAKEPVQIVNLRDLNRLEAGATVTPESLVAAGLVRKADRAIKILGDGELLVKGLVVRIGAISKGATAAITATGGRVSGVVDEEQT